MFESKVYMGFDLQGQGYKNELKVIPYMQMILLLYCMSCHTYPYFSQLIHRNLLQLLACAKTLAVL